MKHLIWLIPLVVHLVGCLGDSRASGSVSWSILLSGAVPENLVFGNRKIEFIRNQFALEEAAARYDNAPVEIVDFSASQVVLLDAGQFPTGGYQLEIDSVVESDGALTLTAILHIPGDNCLVTQAVTEPFLFVRINSPAHLQTVTLKQEVYDCGV